MSSTLSSIIFGLTIGFFQYVNSQSIYSTNYEATAWFSKYASGYVTFINGHLMVDIDVSNVGVGNETVGIPDSCFDDGVYFHIHALWEHDDMEDKQGPTDCGAANTGGHWDPWFGCSTASSATACQNNGGCISGSSVIAINETYECDEDSFDDYYFNCEVSDFTGKYGIREVRSNKVTLDVSSFMEIDGIDVDGMGYSIVFHCTDDDATRAFCAPINVTMDENTDYERETGNQEAEIDFGNGLVAVDDETDTETTDDDTEESGLSLDGTKITLGEGWVRVELSSDIAGACSQWKVEIWDEWNHDSDNAVYDNSYCNMTYVGGIYDPTHSCIEYSGSIYCEDETRCPNSGNSEDVNYDCDTEENALGCAIGDIYGRIGYVGGGNDEYDETFDDRVSMHLDSLPGKALVLTCDNTNQIAASGLSSFCKQIRSSDIDGSSSSSSSSDKFTFGGGFGIFVVIVLVVLIGVGYWKGQQNQKEFGRVEKVAPPVSIQQMEFLQNASAPYPFLTTDGPADTTGSSFVTSGGNTNAVVATGTPPPGPVGDTTQFGNGEIHGQSGQIQGSGGLPPVSNEEQPIQRVETHEVDSDGGNDYEVNSTEYTGNGNTNYGNNLNVNNNNYNDTAVEVTPSASPAVGPYDEPRDPTMPITPQSATAGRLPPPPGRSPPKMSESALANDNDDDDNNDLSGYNNNDNNENENEYNDNQYNENDENNDYNENDNYNENANQYNENANYEDNSGGDVLAEGNGQDDEPDQLEDVPMTGGTTKGGPALPPPPPTATGGYDNDNNNNEDRDSTPEAPATDFEAENGQLPIDDLGDPKM